MIEFKAVARKWGNSLGITLPNDIVDEADIKPEKEVNVIIVEKQVDLSKTFGTLKIKESSQKIKNTMRKGWKPSP